MPCHWPGPPGTLTETISTSHSPWLPSPLSNLQLQPPKFKHYLQDNYLSVCLSISYTPSHQTTFVAIPLSARTPKWKCQNLLGLSFKALVQFPQFPPSLPLGKSFSTLSSKIWGPSCPLIPQQLWNSTIVHRTQNDPSGKVPMCFPIHQWSLLPRVKLFKHSAPWETHITSTQPAFPSLSPSPTTLHNPGSKTPHSWSTSCFEPPGHLHLFCIPFDGKDLYPNLLQDKPWVIFQGPYLLKTDSALHSHQPMCGHTRVLLWQGPFHPQPPPTPRAVSTRQGVNELSSSCSPPRPVLPTHWPQATWMLVKHTSNSTEWNSAATTWKINSHALEE